MMQIIRLCLSHNCVTIYLSIHSFSVYILKQNSDDSTSHLLYTCLIHSNKIHTCFRAHSTNKLHTVINQTQVVSNKWYQCDLGDKSHWYKKRKVFLKEMTRPTNTSIRTMASISVTSYEIWMFNGKIFSLSKEMMEEVHTWSRRPKCERAQRPNSQIELRIAKLCRKM